MIRLRGLYLKMSDNNDLSEIDYYEKILQFFSMKNRDEVKTEKWKDESLIELMNLLKNKEKSENFVKIKDLVQNAIILILSLLDDKPPDFYDTIGKDSKCILLNEKRKLKRKLFNLIENQKI